MKHFLDLEDLDDATLERLLTRAGELERAPVSDALAGKVLALLFFNPSLRTVSSFQAGMAQLGGSSMVLTPGQGTWGLETREGVVMDEGPAEHVKEAVPVLGQYADALGVRCFAEGRDLEVDLSEPTLSAIRDVTVKPLINLESAVNHPCQALADWKTLDDLEVPRRGGRLVLSWAWHPRPLPLAVPLGTLFMGLRRGMEVTVLRPEGYGMPEPVRARARELAARTGARFSETDARGEAMDGAHVVYAKSWRSTVDYGDAEADAARRQGLRGWCVDEGWFAPAAPGAHFMHCLPVRRNVVVADAVLDGPRSRVVRQAGNRLHAQKSVLVEILGGDAS